MQEGVGGGHGELIVGPITRVKVEVRGPRGLSAIEPTMHIAQGQLLAQPMNMTANLRHVEVPPFKRPASEIKMQVGVILSVHGDGAVDVDDRWLLELIGFDGADDMGPNATRDDHGVGRAEAIGKVDLLRDEVRAQTVRGHLLSPALEAGSGDLQKTIGILEGGLESAGGFATEREIGQIRPPPDADSFQVVPISPDLSFQRRRLREGKVIEHLLLFLLQQWAQGPHIERAVDAKVIVPGAGVGLMHGFQPSFGPGDLQIRQAPYAVRAVDMRLSGANRHTSVGTATLKLNLTLQ